MTTLNASIRPKRANAKSMYPSQMLEDPSLGILSQSKKITKARNTRPSTPSPIDSESPNTPQKSKKYETYSNEERNGIVNSIKQLIISFEGSGLSSEQIEMYDYLGYLKRAGTEGLDQLLLTVIPQYKPTLILDKSKLVQLRKKVKSWFTSRQPIALSRDRRALENENLIREVGQIAGNAYQANHPGSQALYRERMQEMYAKAPLVFGPGMSYNPYQPSLNSQDTKLYMNTDYPYMENRCVGEMLDSNGLTTRSNSPLQSPEEGTYEHIEPLKLLQTKDSEDYLWNKYKDDIIVGFWESGKTLFRLGERLGI